MSFKMVKHSPGLYDPLQSSSSLTTFYHWAPGGPSSGHTLFLWSLCSLLPCPGLLDSLLPSHALPLLLFIQEVSTGALTPRILPWPNLLPTYWIRCPYIGSEERFIIEMKEVKAVTTCNTHNGLSANVYSFTVEGTTEHYLACSWTAFQGFLK